MPTSVAGRTSDSLNSALPSPAVSDPKSPVVYLCRGGDCRDRKKARRKLVDQLDGHARLTEVKCQKICRGPVVGLEVDGALEWFAEVDTGKARAAVVHLLDRGELKKPLRKRHVGKKSGKQR